MNISTCYMFS